MDEPSEIPLELIWTTLQYVPLRHLSACFLVSKAWSSISSSDLFWREMAMNWLRRLAYQDQQFRLYLPFQIVRLDGISTLDDWAKSIFSSLSSSRSEEQPHDDLFREEVMPLVPFPFGIASWKDAIRSLATVGKRWQLESSVCEMCQEDRPWVPDQPPPPPCVTYSVPVTIGGPFGAGKSLLAHWFVRGCVMPQEYRWDEKGNLQSGRPRMGSNLRRSFVLESFHVSVDLELSVTNVVRKLRDTTQERRQNEAIREAIAHSACYLICFDASKSLQEVESDLKRWLLRSTHAEHHRNVILVACRCDQRNERSVEVTSLLGMLERFSEENPKLPKVGSADFPFVLFETSIKKDWDVAHKPTPQDDGDKKRPSGSVERLFRFVADRTVHVLFRNRQSGEERPSLLDDSQAMDVRRQGEGEGEDEKESTVQKNRKCVVS